MGESDKVGLVGLILNGIGRSRRFDQGGDVLPLRRDDDHDHQYAGNQRYFVGVPILHAPNVWQFFKDANALPVAIGDIMNTDTPPQLLVFPRPAEGVFLRVLRANIGLMRGNYA